MSINCYFKFPVYFFIVIIRRSIVNLSQIRTIENRRLIGPKIAVLPDEIMEKVDIALKNSLAL